MGSTPAAPLLSRAERRAGRAETDALILQMRTDGASFREMGEAVGMTADSVRNRWRALFDPDTYGMRMDRRVEKRERVCMECKATFTYNASVEDFRMCQHCRDFAGGLSL